MYDERDQRVIVMYLSGGEIDSAGDDLGECVF